MLYLFISVKGLPWLPFWAGMGRSGGGRGAGTMPLGIPPLLRVRELLCTDT